MIFLAAIYARKSTDQSAVADEAKSVTRQVLKELARAGVRVFGYQNDRAISLETPSDTLFTTVNAWKDSEARRESSVCVHDALGRKARVGHVTGGRVFGYRNRDVFEETDAHGRPRRSQVRREIHESGSRRRASDLRTVRRRHRREGHGHVPERRRCGVLPASPGEGRFLVFVCHYPVLLLKGIIFVTTPCLVDRNNMSVRDNSYGSPIPKVSAASETNHLRDYAVPCRPEQYVSSRRFLRFVNSKS